MGMSPYFPHCIKNNKNSVLLKDKKVVLCGRFGCHYLLVTPLGSTSLKKCTEQSKGPIFSSNELNALPGRLASATPRSAGYQPFQGGATQSDSGIYSQFAPLPMSSGDPKA